MNERIKELMVQVCREQGLPFTVEHNRAYMLDNFSEKFAELIVQECSRVVVNGGYWSGGPLGPKRQCTPPEIATMIRQHFGVEE